MVGSIRPVPDVYVELGLAEEITFNRDYQSMETDRDGNITAAKVEASDIV